MMDEIRHRYRGPGQDHNNHEYYIIIIISYTDFAMHTFVSISNIIIYIKMT